jgi:predicted transcriptional regulator
MTMIRKAITKRMKELNLNPNQLSEKLKGKIPRQTIYDFLSGKTDARSEVVSEIIKALGLELVAKKERGKLIAFEFGRKTTKVVIGKKKKAR